MASEIPEKCSQSCPVVRIIQEDIRVHEELEDIIIQDLVSDEFAEDVRTVSEMLQSIDNDMTELTPEALAMNIRTSGSSALEEEKQTIEDHRRDLGDLALGCLGPLKLRATRDNEEFTVTVCASRTILRMAKTGLEFAIIERRIIE